jgi:surface protein
MSLQISISNVIGNSDFRETPPVTHTPFISEWKTTAIDETVTLPYQTNGSYNGTIDWGDGETSPNKYGNRTHIYKFPGTYTITIDGRVRRFRFANTGDKDKIYRIFQWGSQFSLGTGGSQFYGCSNLNLSEVNDVLKVYNPGQTLNEQTRNWTNMFRDCTSLTTINRVNEWDMSNVINLSGCFLDAINFNDDLSGWDTANVTTMLQTFFGSTNFNGDISNWDTSNVINFGEMFRNASAFDIDISNWNVINATTLSSMFRSASAFNRNLGNWDVSNCLSFNNFMLGKTFSDFSTANYDALLIGWASRPVQPNLSINFGTIKRTSASDAAKLVLTSAPNNWTIVDGGI